MLTTVLMIGAFVVGAGLGALALWLWLLWALSNCGPKF